VTTTDAPDKERITHRVKSAAVGCWDHITESPEQIERHKKLCIHMLCVLLLWTLAGITGASFLDMMVNISPLTVQELLDYFMHV
jgi:hypothetical protein